MKKIVITQDELEEGAEKFHLYMLYVKQRISGLADPRTAVFAAVDVVHKDGHEVSLGSFPDKAAQNISDWVDKHYGDRSHISYCFDPVAYEIGGHPYFLRMPVVPVEEIPLTQAVIDMTDDNAASISVKKLKLLEEDYTEFYNALYDISEFGTSCKLHLASSARYILHGKLAYALSRWESLCFVEKAMKEALHPFGIKMTGPDGHDIQNALNAAWIAVGLPPLPSPLLADVMCSTAMRYEETPQPFATTLKAHHSAIRLGSLISKQMQAPPPMGSEYIVKMKEFSADPFSAVLKLLKAVDPSTAQLPKIRLVR